MLVKSLDFKTGDSPDGVPILVENLDGTYDWRIKRGDRYITCYNHRWI